MYGNKHISHTHEGEIINETSNDKSVQREVLNTLQYQQGFFSKFEKKKPLLFINFV